MTDRQVEDLKPGDLVRAWYGGHKWTTCEVLQVSPVRLLPARVKVRRVGKPVGPLLHFPPVWRTASQLCVVYDPLDPRVFADWLEERGHETAAAELRAEFCPKRGE